MRKELGGIPRRSSLVALVLIDLGLGLGSTGCGSIEPVAPASQPTTDPAQLYMSLTLDQRAINLALVPGTDTVRLVATPRDAHGNPMPGLPAPTFQVLDTSKVRVTPDGLLTALGTGSDVIAIVSLTVGQVTHVDTALIKITSTSASPALDTLTIDPLPPDSAIWAIDFGDASITSLIFGPNVLGIFPIPRVVARTVDATGTPVAGLTVDYFSLDSSVATVHRRTGLVALLRPGQVRMVARTSAYGIVRVDTATFTVTMPVGTGFNFTSTRFQGLFGGTEIKIAPYGIVSWSYNLGDPTTADTTQIVFDDPTNVTSPPAAACDLLPDWVGPGFYCGTGNISLLPADNNTDNVYFRQFPMPGVYPFHDTRTGTTGRVVVTTATQ